MVSEDPVKEHEYRRKAGGTVIAVQYTGDNVREVKRVFMNSRGLHRPSVRVDGHPMDLQTIDGEWVPCPAGHWVIAEPVPDRFYPCDPEVFADRYERNVPGAVDVTAQRVIQEHLVVGPRTGQCMCGYGDETLPVSRLGQPHAVHLVEELRAAGVLKENA